jgi:hypothetical protein
MLPKAKFKTEQVLTSIYLQMNQINHQSIECFNSDIIVFIFIIQLFESMVLRNIIYRKQILGPSSTLSFILIKSSGIFW